MDIIMDNLKINCVYLVFLLLDDCDYYCFEWLEVVDEGR